MLDNPSNRRRGRAQFVDNLQPNIPDFLTMSISNGVISGQKEEICRQSSASLPHKAQYTEPMPLSPHLTIYRPKLTSVLSVLHRATGAAVTLALLPLSLWLLLVALGPERYQRFEPLLHHPLSHLLLFCWSWATIYHLGNGIRHLCWDRGLGLELKMIYRSGAAVVLFSLLATLLLWGVG